MNVVREHVCLSLSLFLRVYFTRTVPFWFKEIWKCQDQTGRREAVVCPSVVQYYNVQFYFRCCCYYYYYCRRNTQQICQTVSCLYLSLYSRIMVPCHAAVVLQGPATFNPPAAFDPIPWQMLRNVTTTPPFPSISRPPVTALDTYPSTVCCWFVVGPSYNLSPSWLCRHSGDGKKSPKPSGLNPI